MPQCQVSTERGPSAAGSFVSLVSQMTRIGQFIKLVRREGTLWLNHRPTSNSNHGLEFIFDERRGGTQKSNRLSDEDKIVAVLQEFEECGVLSPKVKWRSVTAETREADKKELASRAEIETAATGPLFPDFEKVQALYRKPSAGPVFVRTLGQKAFCFAFYAFISAFIVLCASWWVGLDPFIFDLVFPTIRTTPKFAFSEEQSSTLSYFSSAGTRALPDRVMIAVTGRVHRADYKKGTLEMRSGLKAEFRPREYHRLRFLNYNDEVVVAGYYEYGRLVSGTRDVGAPVESSSSSADVIARFKGTLQAEAQQSRLAKEQREKLAEAGFETIEGLFPDGMELFWKDSLKRYGIVWGSKFDWGTGNLAVDVVPESSMSIDSDRARLFTVRYSSTYLRETFVTRKKR